MTGEFYENMDIQNMAMYLGNIANAFGTGFISEAL